MPRAAATTHVPRQGPAPGYGRIQVYDNTVLAGIEVAPNFMQDHMMSGDIGDLSPAAAPSERASHVGGLIPSRRASMASLGTAASRTPTAKLANEVSFSRRPGAVRSMAISAAGTAAAPGEQNAVARRQVELKSKYDRAESVRGKDAKEIQDRVKRMHELREERFKRLLDGITAQGELHYQTAMALRDRTERMDNQVRQLHAEMEEKVFEPMERQCAEYLNPPDRRVEHQLSGTKKVGFELPGQTFRLSYNVLQDPARRPLVEAAKENAFHQAAEVLLGRSQSAPSLHGLLKQGPPAPNRNSMIPQSLSRNTLEPENWHQVALQGTLFGHNAQVSEQGHGFKRARRGGAGVHVPDESDGVVPAGTRRSRTVGINDKGILHSTRAFGGETMAQKTDVGHSSVAPGQDHYTYEVGGDTTDLEFPLGKRLFPEYYIQVDNTKFWEPHH